MHAIDCRLADMLRERSLDEAVRLVGFGRNDRPAESRCQSWPARQVLSWPCGLGRILVLLGYRLEDSQFSVVEAGQEIRR